MTVQSAFALAVQHHQAGRLPDAEALYRQIVAAQPNHSAAHANLGEICRQTGRLEEAIASLRRALEWRPNLAEAHNNLGLALKDHGDWSGAAAAYRRAIALKPDFVPAHNNLGNALQFQGQLEAAADAYRRAIHWLPNYPQAHNNLGNVLKKQGQPEEALAAYRQALQLKPGYPEAHYNMGNALKELGRLDEAVDAYSRALHFKRDYAEAHENLAIVLAGQGRLDEAVAACCHALALRPQHAETHNTLGGVLARRRQLDQAEATYRRALALQPHSPEVCRNLAGILLDQGQVDDAIEAYRRALQFQPEHAATHSDLILTLHLQSDQDGHAVAEEHRRWGERFSDPFRSSLHPHLHDRSPERRLRIGYVSPDFCDHVLGRNLRPLFHHHDHQQFEILCYAGATQPDGFTEDFRQHADQWRSTVGVADDAFAEMIRQDGVDILVDLNQHMAGNRLPMFSRQPTPVQVSFAGYPASAGVEAIPYRISDRYLESEMASELRSPSPQLRSAERILLIDSFWCYDPCGIEVEVNGLPARESGNITFGCLNNFCKVNEQALSLWAQVLGKVTDSRLILLTSVGSHRQRAREFLEKKGIESHRVDFVEFRPRREYLKLYHRLDIILDTFPYNGHTTSLDALWMGVPVVSLAGETPVSRAGLSQLSNLGLPEWVAHSESEYVKIAEKLAGDLPRLAQLRSTLRERMENSVLMDAPRFARQVEEAYRKMWKRWCAASG